MKTFAIASAVCALFVSHISAQCICDPNDTHCLNQCVADTNNCVSECKSNTECYSRCIEYHWPTGSETSDSSFPSSTLSGTSTYTISTQPTGTTWYSSSSQSASWTSSASWTPSQTILATSTPSTSGSNKLSVHQAILGMALTAAAYYVY